MSEANRAYRRHRAELDLFAGVGTRRVGEAWTALIVGGLVLWLLNAQALSDWAFNLPLWLGPVRAAAMGLADTVTGITGALGLDTPRALVTAFRDWLIGLG